MHSESFETIQASQHPRKECIRILVELNEFKLVPHPQIILRFYKQKAAFWEHLANFKVSPPSENFGILQAKWCILRAFGQFKGVPNFNFCIIIL